MATVRRHMQSANHTNHHDVKKQLETVFDDIKGLGAESKRAAKKQMKQARSTFDGYARQGKKSAVAFEKSFEDRIRDEPVKALLMASGIGFLCGLIFRRH